MYKLSFPSEVTSLEERARGPLSCAYKGSLNGTIVFNPSFPP